MEEERRGEEEDADPHPSPIPSEGRGRIVGGATIIPLGHLGGENVEVAIAIDVGNLQAVAVDHGATKKIVACPVGSLFRIANAFVPAQRTGAVARSDDDLRTFAGFKSAGGD